MEDGGQGDQAWALTRAVLAGGARLDGGATVQHHRIAHLRTHPAAQGAHCSAAQRPIINHSEAFHQLIPALQAGTFLLLVPFAPCYPSFPITSPFQLCAFIVVAIYLYASGFILLVNLIIACPRNRSLGHPTQSLTKAGGSGA